MGLPKIIAIVGTNASGKSSIGIELAKKFNGEIISADSRQIYRGFDLCCGKISAEEAKMVPHHLLDIKEIGDFFSEFDFQQMTYSLIPQILDRGRIPFIVGGSGEYVRSVVEGYLYDECPPDAELRSRLEKRSLEELQVQAMLTPEGKSYFSSHPSELLNKRRVIRKLEKIAHGVPLEAQQLVRYNVLQLGITWPKEKLHKRIEERLDSRIRAGMIDEVRVYLENGGSQEYLKSLGLEYKEILLYLIGEYKTLEEFKLKMAQRIKYYAKQQMKFFKKDASIHWLDMNSNYLEEAYSLISMFLAYQSE